jgi:carbon storage regulator
MLVLTRRIGEEIVIDGDIRVTLVAIKGDTARLGITAPKEIPVQRQEIHEGASNFKMKSASRRALRTGS